MLIVDHSRVTFLDLHFGHGGAGLSDLDRYSSYFSEHESHWYS